jgi:hypothetical protein
MRTFTSDEVRILTAYCHKLRDEFAGTDILGTGMNLPFRIARALLSEQARKRNEEEKTSADFGHSGPGLNAPGDRRAGTEPEPESAILRFLLAAGANRRVFITGDGGTGKTGIVRYLCFAAANQLLGVIKGGNPADAMVPIHCHLKWLLRPRDGDLLSSWCPEQLKVLLAKLKGNGQVLLLLDGLDELNSAFATDEFDGLMKRMLDELGDQCALVLSGRESALRSGLRQFFPSDRYYRLELLSQPQIENFIRLFFGKSSKGAALIAQVRQSDRGVRHLLQRPFFLVIACELFKSSKTKLPQSPRDIVSKSIDQILGRRERDDANPRGMDLELHVARSCLAQLAAFSCEQSFEFSAGDDGFPVNVTSKVLRELDPQSGVLASSGGGERLKTYTFTNRVIAEFLAGDYLAEHGEEQFLLNFYSRNAWSSQRRELLRWLGAALWHHKPKLAVPICRWLLKQIDEKHQSEECRWNRDDLHHTLRDRFFDLMSAAPRHAAEDHPVMKLAGELWAWIDPNLNKKMGNYDEGFVAAEVLGALPTRLSDPYRRTLLEDLSECTGLAEHELKLDKLVDALASGWPGDTEVLQQLLAILDRFKNSGMLNGSIFYLAKALASGWPGNREARERLLSVLSLCTNPAAHSFAISGLADALASGWGGEHEHKVRGSLMSALSLCLHPTTVTAVIIAGHERSLFESPYEMHGRPIATLAKALASSWPGDRAVCKNLLSVLSRCSPVYHGAEIGGVAEALISCCADKGMVRERLLEFLARCSNPKTQREAVDGVAQALVSAWPGNQDVQDRLLSVLSFCADNLVEHQWVIATMAPALASCRADRRQVREALSEVMSRCTDPEHQWILIDGIARSLTSGWPGNRKVHKCLLSILSLCTDPEKHSQAILGLTEALASGWSGRREVGELVLEVLTHHIEAGEWDGNAIKCLADALALRWAGKQEVRDRLLKLLARCTNPERTSISSLASALTSGWPGEPTIAATVISRGCESYIRESDQWRTFAVFIATRDQLDEYVTACGWNLATMDFAMKEIMPNITQYNWRNSDETTVPRRTVLIARREQIRRGLSAELLASVVAGEVPLIGHKLVANRKKYEGTEEPVAEPKSSPLRYVFHRSSEDKWKVSFGPDPNVYILDHLEGFDYIAQLLERPDTPISDVRLCGKGSEQEIRAVEEEKALPTIDDTELEYLREKLEEAKKLSKSPNPKFAEQGWNDMAAIRTDLENRVPKRGRRAMNRSNHKRAQTTVDKALKAAYKRLKPVAGGALLAHLQKHLVKPEKGYHHTYKKPVSEEWDVSWMIPR